MTKADLKRGSFLCGLLRDEGANTIAIAAAALIPLLAMVGGGVDASRYYMANSRLQQACDAGALAARKNMGDATFTDEDKNMGLAFFDQNYPDGTFGLTSLSRDYTADSDGTVTGTASGALPLSLMQIFGFGEFSVAVSCTAEINISNTDVMFVLDVTGSMNCPVSSTSCTNNGNVEASDAKIKALRSAVLSFYDTVASATSSSAQVRYGVVPYSSNVNVGGSIPAAYMASSHTYQSREAQWQTNWEEQSVSISNVTGPHNYDYGSLDVEETHRNVYSESDCQDILASSGLTGTEGEYKSGSLTYNDADVSQTTSGTTRTTVGSGEITLTGTEPGYTYSSRRDRCRIGYYDVDYDATSDFTLIEEEVTSFAEWQYKPVTFDLTSLYDDNWITLPTGYQGGDENHQWEGCVEEANTVNDLTFDPLPSGANDLQIDLIPSGASTYWKPQLPDAVYKRENGGYYYGTLTQTGNENHPSNYCPKAAQRLTDMSRTELETYVSAADGFTAIGSTYHDFGMIWGGRFISPDGIFAADNATAPNGDAIARHIIFMTDGTQSTSNNTYGLYGIEWWDRRVTTDGSTDIEDRHAARFQAACKQARQANMSVWVVAFGTSLSQNLIDCASPGKAFHADNDADLASAFEEIAQKIAALRLTS